MEHLTIVAFMAVLVVCVLFAYFFGRAAKGMDITDAEGRCAVAEHKLDITRKVQHNLNCLVTDLRFEVSVHKPKSQAYDTCVGLWATDQPNLIKHHIHRERFFRIGYPEHKL